MTKYLSLIVLFFSLNTLAQDYVSPPPVIIDSGANYLMINAATTTSDSNVYVPAADECYSAASHIELYPNVALVVRLAKFDFQEYTRVYLDTWLCHDKNFNNCVHVRESKLTEMSLPLSLGIASRDIGCLLAHAEHNKKSYKYLTIQIMKRGLFIDQAIYTDYVKIEDLSKLNTLETSNNGILVTFPVQMNE